MNGAGRFHTFPNRIISKVNVTVRYEFELKKMYQLQYPKEVYQVDN